MRSLSLLVAFVLSFSVAHAAPSYIFQPTILPQTDSLFDLGTSTRAWRNIFTDRLCLGGDCQTAWPTGGGSSAYEIATTSAISIGQLSYFTQTSGRTTLGGVGTSTLTIGAPLTTSGTPGALVGGTNLTIDIDDIKAADLDLTDITLNDFTNDSGYFDQLSDFTGTLTDTKFCTYDLAGGEIDCASDGASGITAIGPTGQTADGPTVTFATSSSAHLGITPHLVITGSGDTLTFASSLSGSLDTSGTWSGNAVTATALAANGANCSAGNYPLGVDASGAVEDCTPDANTTYTAGDALTLTGTDFDFDGLAVDGALSGPAYSFASDTNTGMFLVSSGILGFSIDGTGRAALSSTQFYPYSDNATSLGSSGNAWSDLFLASGSVINWNSSDIALTHSANALTFSGMASGLDLGASSGLLFGGISILTDLTGNTTLDNIDGLGATTETTIEAAIDTLANLTSIQGNTVTLTGAFIRSGAHSLTLTTTNTTTLTLPTSGTLAVLGGNTFTGTHDFSGATLRAPYGTAPTVSTNGDVGIDSTSNQFKYQSGGATRVLGNGNFYPAFTYATTSWTGTTTIPLGPAYVGETWNGVKCFTDTGTLFVRFTDATNHMNDLQASTTVGTHTFTTNNTFTSSEKRYVDVGNPASSPKYISCTLSKSLTAD